MAGGLYFRLSCTASSYLPQLPDRRSHDEQRSWFPSCRLYVVVEVLKMVLGCFFAFWFVLGNIWAARVSSDAENWTCYANFYSRLHVLYAVGVLAAGTEQERAISEEDAVCCICLEKYIDNDELRELPCGHFFHKECVDEWLKINARCPLCQSEIGRTHGASTFVAGSSQNPSERRTGSTLDEDGGGHGSTVA
ncbi:E3 ubiquitin-protein ligase [Vitis vinifera]|uniref:E3 ubiquitin-protein ligase n=1 Tax=Vitis vinifera TaxID=29760 RepID=A0A438GZ92_VITVI|nr:E3 ubiquitin-protein ligase [Vitis vinifera]